MLLLINWTASFAQLSTSSQDTIKCYGISELRKIASLITECQACDTLLENAKAKINNRNQVIDEKQIQIDNLNKQILYKDTLITNRETDIKTLKDDVNRLQNLKDIFKKGWIATGSALTIIIIILLL
jgi:uncharacterized protein (DUF3084 family)